MNWRPNAPLANLRLRAAMLNRVRQFFADREVLEVETPLLCQATVTDLHLESLQVQLTSADIRYLQTSPEFAMKRLLSAGSGAIYQLCKAFRSDETGRRHNPEFTMLEWYRPQFDDVDLMAEVEALLRVCLPAGFLPQHPLPRISYRELFQHYLNLDPHAVGDDDLLRCVAQHVDTGAMTLSRDDALNLLMSHVIEPQLQDAVFVYAFPASQAALAQTWLDEKGVSVARRFELFVKGMELANGYLELTDADEQARRFAADNRQRKADGRAVRPVDQRLLAAMTHGLPPCAGVALGFDRLVMLAAGVDDIAEVVSFTAVHA